MSVRAYPAYKESGSSLLGPVPSHWGVVQIKRFARLVYGEALPTEVRKDDGSIPVYGSNGPVGTHDIANTAAPAIIVGRKGSHGALNWTETPGFAIDTAYYIDQTSAVCDLRWLLWALHAANLSAFSQDTGVPGLARELVHDTRYVLPPPAEQSAIAAFLDRETGKIDALVAEQERLMALLKEKRQAVISQAVTKGLNPNAKMKPSGVEWLGDVPAHWTTQPLKRLIAEGSSISYGIVQPGEPQDEGVPFVQTTNMSSGTFVVEELQRTTPEIASAYPRSRLNGGEVILGIRASIGAAYVVPTRLAGVNLSRGVARIECGPNIDPAFLVAYLRSDSVAEYWALAKQGSTFNEVSIETVRDLVVPVPPVSEQRQVASDAASQDQTFMALIGEAGRAVALLKERRAALISAAVTGKIDVRDPMTTEAAAA